MLLWPLSFCTACSYCLEDTIIHPSSTHPPSTIHPFTHLSLTLTHTPICLTPHPSGLSSDSPNEGTTLLGTPTAPTHLTDSLSQLYSYNCFGKSGLGSVCSRTLSPRRAGQWPGTYYSFPENWHTANTQQPSQPLTHSPAPPAQSRDTASLSLGEADHPVVLTGSSCLLCLSCRAVHALVPGLSLRATWGGWGKATDHQSPACPWGRGDALAFGRETVIMSLCGLDFWKVLLNKARIQTQWGWVVHQASCPGDTL